MTTDNKAVDALMAVLGFHFALIPGVYDLARAAIQAALASERAKADDARRAAQTEAEELKALLARSGLEQTKAVLDARRDERAKALEDAANDLRLMESRKDEAYLERNRCVALAARMAVSMGLPVALTKTTIEGWSEYWHGCIYIRLPTGQVSWHFHDSQAHLFDGLPQLPDSWDGHDTPEKYRRVSDAFRAQEPT